MKKYKIFVLSFLLLLPAFSRADTNTFTFSTDPQSVAVGATSGKINVQSSIPVTETTYLSFTSSSATGQFLTSTGNPLTSAYISSGDSNRAVYYKDNTVGDFVISADVLNKDKTKITTISQHIYIGQSSPSGTSTTTDTTIATTTNNNSSSNNTTTIIYSAHSSPVPLSTAKEFLGFEISAGRERLTSVGNEVPFQAVVTKGNDNVLEKNVGYLWSFGDGSIGMGDSPIHIYKFPGEYTVVVNASFSDLKAVARTNVKVVEPKISINRVVGGLEIINNTAVEINLGGWMLKSGSQKFTFPKDTLVSAGKKITVSDEVTGINNGSVDIESPITRVYAEVALPKLAVVSLPVATTTEKVISTFSASTTEVQNKIVTVAQIKKPVTNLVLKPKTSSSAGKAKISISTNATQTASAVTVFVASSSPNTVSSIVFWPFRFIGHLFAK